jgi:hypothetical protein
MTDSSAASPVEMANNAAVLARTANKESWRIGEVPLIAAPCRCGAGAFFRDPEIGGSVLEVREAPAAGAAEAS